MPRFLKNISKKTGTAPGTLIHIGDKKAEHTTITLMEYDADSSTQRTISSLAELEALTAQPMMIRWINIDGLHDLQLIESIGGLFDIHPLTLEDIVNTGHRPKTESFGDYIFTIIKMLRYNKTDSVIISEQVSLIIRDRLLISFQEQPEDVFDSVRKRIQNKSGRIRRSGSDYLAYTLLDTLVDHYYYILESFGEEIESLEDAILENPNRDSFERIHELKREMVYLRKQIWPFRETINTLSHDDSPFISEQSRLFFRDVQDHTIQVIEIIDSYRDILTGLLDLYMTAVSNRMNEVMKVLTIIATIFIPITFVAGIYGMNFKYMPELDWRWGYGGALMLMAGIAVIMLFYFKKKKWL